MARPRFVNLQEALDRHLFEKVCCIYLLRCKTTGYCYVGSCRDLYTRLRRHTHYQHSYQLRNTFETYGVAQHEVALLEICPLDLPVSDLRMREAFWLWNYRARLNSQLPCLKNGNLRWLFNPEFQSVMSNANLTNQRSRLHSQDLKEPLEEFDMKKAQNLVPAYHKLLQEHNTYVQSQVNQLKQLVDSHIQAIQEQEKAMLQAQKERLNDIQLLLRKDARCLLGTHEFISFVEQLREPPTCPSEPDTTWFQPNIDPLSWSLASLDSRVILSRFRLKDDREACDDEEVYTSYEYTMILQVSHFLSQVTVQLGRLIHSDPPHHVTCSDREQQQEILIQILGPFKLLTTGNNQVDQLIKELSCLVCFAGKLLASESHPFEFTYP